MLTVPENWYGNFPNQQVECTLTRALAPKKNKKDSYCCVSVWGDDDFGMFKDFHHTEYQLAKALYDSLNNGITQQELYELGFQRA